LIQATRSGLADFATELDAEYKTRLENAVGAVESALGTENPQSHAGDLRQLQAACAALDETSKPLAELLMDKAMETLLRKRGII